MSRTESQTETRWQTPDASLVSAGSPMNRSSATRILVLVSLSCLSNSNQPKRSCAFFIGIRLPTRRARFRISRASPCGSAGSCENRDLFERARLSGCEHDGKLLHESFPLADDGGPVRLFFRELRRDLLALQSRDVAFLASAEDAVDPTGTGYEANLAGVQRCEGPSSDYGWLRGKNSRRLPGRQRRRDQVLQLVERQPFESQCDRAGRWHGVWIFAELGQLR